MKRNILYAIILPLLMAGSVSAASNLWEYYQEQGLELPSVEQRAGTYNLYFSDIYKGTAEQNVRFLAELQNIENTAFGGFKFVAGSKYKLDGSGVSATDTTVNLTSFKMPVSEIELSMDDFGDIGYATIEPFSSTKKEFISFTGVTQSGSSDKASLTGVTRGLNFVSPYTASSTLRQSHSGGTTLVISNPPQLYNKLSVKSNNETITGIWTFDADKPPIVDAATTATSSEQFVTKRYVDNTTNQGAATSTLSVGGILEMGSALQAASTTDDGANRPYALTTNISSAGCTVATSTVVVTKSDGRIGKNCMSTSTAYALFGANFGTTTPASGTLVIEQNGTLNSFYVGDTGTSSPLFLIDAKGNVGIGTTTPASELAVTGTTTTDSFFMKTGAKDGKVLTSNSIGAGTYEYPPVITVTASTTQYSYPAGTASTTPFTANISADALGANGTIEFYMTGTGQGTTNHHWWGLYLNDNIVDIRTFRQCSRWTVHLFITARNSTSSQIKSGWGTKGGVGCTEITRIDLDDNGSPTSIDLSSDFDLSIKMQNENSGDTFTYEQSFIRILRSP